MICRLAFYRCLWPALCGSAKAVRAQTAIEYAALLAILVFAGLTAQIYVKRGLMGRYHQMFEASSDPYIPGQVTSDEHLVQTGTMINDVAVTDLPHNAGDELPQQRQTAITFTSTDDVQQQGGETVMLDLSHKLFR